MPAGRSAGVPAGGTLHLLLRVGQFFLHVRQFLPEPQQPPGDGDADRADAHEAADIDHAGQGRAGLADDEIDQASAEYNQSFIFRLRDREKYYLSKIDKALKKIDDGDFGVCESCGEEISTKRLEARPVTTLCILCKEEQEMEERSYA